MQEKFKKQISCSPNPTTNSEMTNPEFFTNFLTNQIGFNEKKNNRAKKQTRLVKLVLIGHKIHENEDL